MRRLLFLRTVGLSFRSIGICCTVALDSAIKRQDRSRVFGRALLSFLHFTFSLPALSRDSFTNHARLHEGFNSMVVQ